MIYASACSGIEAASEAWKNIPDWEAKWFSEIDPFCNALLKDKYKNIPNLGKLETIDDAELVDKRKIELLVAGTPCQSFSINGLQEGLEHANGNLAIEFIKLAGRIKPRWIVWENVPGVLSCNKGRDFAAIVGKLVEFGYGVCWRVLDSRYFGIPQSRRRVFVIGYLNDWRPAAAVLFEGHQRPSIANEGETTRVANNSNTSEKIVSKSVDREIFRINKNDGRGVEQKTTGQNNGEDRSKTEENREEFILGWAGDETTKVSSDILPTLKSQQGGEGTGICIASPLTVRRLTVTEYERAMGFPDGYTKLEGFSDRVRQKALGNSMAVPVMRWLGERIQIVDDLIKGENMKNVSEKTCPKCGVVYKADRKYKHRSGQCVTGVQSATQINSAPSTTNHYELLVQKIEQMKSDVAKLEALRQELDNLA